MTSAPALRLGGDPASSALHLDGRAVTYRELAGRVADRAGQRSAESPPTVLDLTGLGVTATLVEVFAGAAAGRRVRLADPATPPPVTQPSAAPTADPTPADPEPPADPTPADPEPPADGTAPDPQWLTVVTSGSSGAPRPVRRSVASWTSSFAPLSALIGLRPTDRVLLTGPLHATLHLFAAVHTLAAGAELTDDPTRATLAHAVPAVLGDLIGDPRAAGLRTVVVAGSALPVELLRAATDRGLDVVEYYGAAELSFVAADRRDPTPGIPPGLPPFPGVEIDVRDGEIRVRSPYLSAGYPAAISGPFRRDPDGFATVGDRGTLSPEGRLQVHGRGSSAITVGGATVLAEDVEAALAPLVELARRAGESRPPTAVAVVGAPVARLGAVVVAVVVDDPALDGGALRASARRSLAGAARPRRWLVADRLPRTSGGKLARGALGDAVRRHLTGVPPEPGDPVLGPLR